MLSKIISRQLKIKGFGNNQIPRFLFASDHHDHHDYSVHIDKNATWIKYKTNRRLACVEGIQDTHIQIKDPCDTDPFLHIKQNPVYSLQNLAYNDAYYHQDDHEALVNAPHGYVQGSDPVDMRWDVIVPNVLAISSIGLMLYIIFVLEQTPTLEGRLYRQKLAIDRIEEDLDRKNNELNDIKDRIRELSNKK